MNIDQWANLKDFSLRFAREHYAKRQQPSLLDIEEDIETIFDEVDPASIDCWIDLVGYLEELHDCLWWEPSCCVGPKRFRVLEELFARENYEEYDRLKASFVSAYSQPLRCCLRIGIDLISGETGVLGFTAGDLKMLYPGRDLPTWVDVEFGAMPLSALPDLALIAL